MNQPFLNCLSPLFQTSQHLMQWNWAWFAWKRSVLNKAKHKEEDWFCPEAISLDVKYQCTYFPRCHLAPMVLSPSPAQTSTWTVLWHCFLAESFRETKISHSFDISTYCWDLFYFQQVLWVLISFFSYTLDYGIFLKQTPGLQAAGRLCSAHLLEVYQTTRKEESNVTNY